MEIEESGYQFAEESDQLQRAREKLTASFKKNVFTKDQLERKVVQIKDKIDRNAHREVITEKAFTHFDNNQNSAPVSAKISEIAKSLSEKLGVDAKR